MRCRCFAILGTSVLCVLVGCAPRKPVEVPDPVPLRQAARVVNDNASKVVGALRATGSASGHFTTPEGRRRHFDLDGILFCLPPAGVRFDLKSIVGTEILVGSNAEHVWTYNRQGGDLYVCRPIGALNDGSFDRVPIRPDQVVDAIGLGQIPTDRDRAGQAAVVQRVVDSYQQILFIERSESWPAVLQKEYWVDRFPPNLVRRVVYRDSNGAVEMESVLGEYDSFADDSPLMPHYIEVRWPEMGSTIIFRVRKWKSFDSVTADGPQFTPPHVLGIRYENEDIVE